MPDNNLIIVKALVKLSTSGEGGRTTAITSGYRPNHVFERPKGNGPLRSYIGDIVFNDQGCIRPGETKLVVVRFMRNPLIEKFMNVGQKWFIHEGSKLVGEGEIIEI